MTALLEYLDLFPHTNWSSWKVVQEYVTMGSGLLSTTAIDSIVCGTVMLYSNIWVEYSRFQNSGLLSAQPELFSFFTEAAASVASMVATPLNGSILRNQDTR